MKFTFLFKETRTVKVKSLNSKTVAMKFVTDETEKQMTLQELISEYKPTMLWFSDDYGHQSSSVNFQEVSKRLNERPNLVYYVRIAGTNITFFPQVKTKEEMKIFADGVRSCGALD